MSGFSHRGQVKFLLPMAPLSRLRWQAGQAEETQIVQWAWGGADGPASPVESAFGTAMAVFTWNSADTGDDGPGVHL